MRKVGLSESTLPRYTKKTEPKSITKKTQITLQTKDAPGWWRPNVGLGDSRAANVSLCQWLGMFRQGRATFDVSEGYALDSDNLTARSSYSRNPRTTGSPSSLIAIVSVRPRASH